MLPSTNLLQDPHQKWTIFVQMTNKQNLFAVLVLVESVRDVHACDCKLCSQTQSFCWNNKGQWPMLMVYFFYIPGIFFFHICCSFTDIVLWQLQTDIWLIFLKRKCPLVSHTNGAYCKDCGDGRGAGRVMSKWESVLPLEIIHILMLLTVINHQINCTWKLYYRVSTISS